MINTGMKEKFLSYYNFCYNSLLLQDTIDSFSSPWIVNNLPMLQAVRQLNSESVENCPIRNNAGSPAVACYVRSSIDQEQDRPAFPYQA
eukprot:14514784-Ditylum_brightwellii.AAC.1